MVLYYTGLKVVKTITDNFNYYSNTESVLVLHAS